MRSVLEQAVLWLPPLFTTTPGAGMPGAHMALLRFRGGKKNFRHRSSACAPEDLLAARLSRKALACQEKSSGRYHYFESPADSAK